LTDIPITDKLWLENLEREYPWLAAF
jgi:hypothetical protein